MTLEVLRVHLNDVRSTRRERGDARRRRAEMSTGMDSCRRQSPVKRVDRLVGRRERGKTPGDVVKMRERSGDGKISTQGSKRRRGRMGIVPNRGEAVPVGLRAVVFSLLQYV